jgi:hypothetical protein
MSINPETCPGTKKRRPTQTNIQEAFLKPTQHDQSRAIGNIPAMELQRLLMHNRNPNTTMLYYMSDKRKWIDLALRIRIP